MKFLLYSPTRIGEAALTLKPSVTKLTAMTGTDTLVCSWEGRLWELLFLWPHSDPSNTLTPISTLFPLSHIYPWVPAAPQPEVQGSPAEHTHPSLFNLSLLQRKPKLSDSLSLFQQTTRKFQPQHQLKHSAHRLEEIPFGHTAGLPSLHSKGAAELRTWEESSLIYCCVSQLTHTSCSSVLTALYKHDSCLL